MPTNISISALPGPYVSIILPVYNCEPFLAETLESILKQTLESWECLIYDDASTDNTIQVLTPFLRDKRFRLIKGKSNKGMAYGLNTLLQQAQGKYLARIDGDDIALPNRLAKQVKFLEKNSDIFACGTTIEVFGEDIISHSVKRPLNHEGIWAAMMFTPGVAHPSVMMRGKDVRDLNLHYPDVSVTQDYPFWMSCMLDHNLKFANLPAVLLRYRLHKNNTSSNRRAVRDNVMQQCYVRYFNEIGFLTHNKESLLAHLSLAQAELHVSFQSIINHSFKLCSNLKTIQQHVMLFKMFFRLLIKEMVKYFKKYIGI